MPADTLITLTTDFGHQDPFVGIIKGIIFKTNPHVRIIDLTHGIRSHDIREAAFTIGLNFEYYPRNTIHMVVVDPGVGSARRPIIVSADSHYFVGPDNGVFSYIYEMPHETLGVFHITAEHYFISSEGATFHARDIFAPTAAYLSRGVHIQNFGDPIEDYFRIQIPFPQRTQDNKLQGEVILIDKFGNAITNIRAADIQNFSSARTDSVVAVACNDRRVPLMQYYAQVKDKGLYSVINSSGCLELFVYRGDASSDHTISVGDSVELFLTP
jgi:S-adenosylmethionine hydrolase